MCLWFRCYTTAAERYLSFAYMQHKTCKNVSHHSGSKLCKIFYTVSAELFLWHSVLIFCCLLCLQLIIEHVEVDDNWRQFFRHYHCCLSVTVVAVMCYSCCLQIFLHSFRLSISVFKRKLLAVAREGPFLFRYHSGISIKPVMSKW